ncbi:uncharacterized protein LTR77_003415 [Saxophila tyrrhenica]|uniref:Uncharacterized protein n=1 Tax=Saxophila tyrrhenica TaxID=1690608 RepID=A0AAV9PGZ1_9PEZI|nr:hypothetical protein LTR77_003415 [Saxophila tyrrhenica]
MSISPPPSSSRWAENDGENVAARHSGAREPDGRRELKMSTVGAGDVAAGQQTSFPPGDYQVDENLFYSAPSEPLDGTASANAPDSPQEAAAYEEPAPEDLLPPPDFKPFFTVIEDPDTGEHVHPTVHYIFSDDDPEILTSAALDCIDQHQDGTQQAEEEEERYVIVDMAADGKTAASTTSLSPHWQAVTTAVTQAPSWGNDAVQADRRLMLKVSGQEMQTYHGKSSKQRKTSKDIDALVKTFSDRLDGLDKVVGRWEDMPDDYLTT